MHFLAYFFGGAFLTNAVPHFVSGVTGRPFQSPFAKPPGKGLSSANVNVLWGFANFVAAWFLLGRDKFAWRDFGDILPLGLGVLAVALFASRHFGALHGGDLRNPP